LGYTADEVALKLAKNDERRAKMYLFLMGKMAADDMAMQLALGTGSKGMMMLGLPATSMAVVRRASKGNIPAAKLLFEATGFHSPHIQHEHSGDINITIHTAPRPERTLDLVDADVVED
jgi:hypothetical protein